jgi:hypothetical protein
MSTIIDLVYNDNQTLIKFLEERGEISLKSSASESFRKSLLLAVASYFESVVQDAIREIVEVNLANARPLYEFVKNKAMARQYHTFFNWDARNANSFFGLFGGDFKDFMIAKVKDDSALEAGIKAFLQLGESRNELVHENFATFVLDKTAEEIYELYKKALRFVETFPLSLSEFCSR